MKLQVEIELFTPDVKPRKEEEEFSVDVRTIDDMGLNGLAYYDYEFNKWNFLTDTITNPETTKWKWYYPPVSIEQAFKEQ